VPPKAREFYKYSHELSESLSQPSIMFKARLNNGQEIILCAVGLTERGSVAGA